VFPSTQKGEEHNQMQLTEDFQMQLTVCSDDPNNHVQLNWHILL